MPIILSYQEKKECCICHSKFYPKFCKVCKGYDKGYCEQCHKKYNSGHKELMKIAR